MMKKCFTLLLAAVMMAVMSSCRPSVDDVASKIVENQELTSAEYEVIIDYMLDAMNELSDSTEVYKDSPTQLLQSMMRMSQEYEYKCWASCWKWIRPNLRSLFLPSIRRRCFYMPRMRRHSRK